MGLGYTDLKRKIMEVKGGLSRLHLEEQGNLACGPCHDLYVIWRTLDSKGHSKAQKLCHMRH